MRRAAVVICAGTIAALCACTMEPHYSRPAAPVAPTWNGNAARAADKTDVADLGWRQFFPDPVLQRLIGLALANNRDLRVAVLNVQATQAQYRIQRADLFPTVAATGLEEVEHFPAGVVGGSTTGASTGTSGGGAGPVIPGGSTFRFFELGVGFTSYELDLFGKIRSLNHAVFLEQYSSLPARRPGAAPNSRSSLKLQAPTWPILADDNDPEGDAGDTRQPDDLVRPHEEKPRCGDHHGSGTSTGSANGGHFCARESLLSTPGRLNRIAML